MATLAGVAGLLYEARVKVFEAGRALKAFASLPHTHRGGYDLPDPESKEFEKAFEELRKLDRLVHILEADLASAQRDGPVSGPWDHLED